MSIWPVGLEAAEKWSVSHNKKTQHFEKWQYFLRRDEKSFQYFRSCWFSWWSIQLELQKFHCIFYWEHMKKALKPSALTCTKLALFNAVLRMEDFISRN